MPFSLIKIYPVAGKEFIVIDVLDSLKGPLSANPDCLDCIVAIDADQSGHIVYLERWKTFDALQNHLHTDLFSRVLHALECSDQPPEVLFCTTEKAFGLELVDDVRRSVHAMH